VNCKRYPRIRFIKIKPVIQHCESVVQRAFFDQASYDDLIILVNDPESRQKVVAFDKSPAVNDVKNRRADLRKTYDKTFFEFSFADYDQKRDIIV
jgi:hypothetical protein